MSFETMYDLSYSELSRPGYLRFCEQHKTCDISINPEITYQQILKAGGKILPVESIAFEDNDCMPGWPDDKIRSITGHPTIRAFYQHLGIQIDVQHKNWPGWHHCLLPDGWQAAFYQDLTINCRNFIPSNRTSPLLIVSNHLHTPQFGIQFSCCPDCPPFVITIITNPKYLSYSMKFPCRP